MIWRSQLSPQSLRACAVAAATVSLSRSSHLILSGAECVQSAKDSCGPHRNPWPQSLDALALFLQVPWCAFVGVELRSIALTKRITLCRVQRARSKLGWNTVRSWHCNGASACSKKLCCDGCLFATYAIMEWRNDGFGHRHNLQHQQARNMNAIKSANATLDSARWFVGGSVWLLGYANA